MFIKTTTITIEMTPGGIPPVVKVSQYDTARHIDVNFVDNGAPYTHGATAFKIEGTKPDGTGFSYTNAVYQYDETSCSISLKDQMTACPGKVPVQIVMEEGTNRLATAKFILDVESAALDDGVDIDSASDLAPYKDAARQSADRAAETYRLVQEYAIQTISDIDDEAANIADTVYQRYLQEYADEEF